MKRFVAGCIIAITFPLWGSWWLFVYTIISMGWLVDRCHDLFEWSLEQFKTKKGQNEQRD